MSSGARAPLDPDALNLEAAIRRLSRRETSSSAGFAARLEAMNALSRSILTPGSGLRRRLPGEGLAFLASFLAKSALDAQICREVKVPASLDAFVCIERRKSLRTVPRGLVCHWIAGNVPLLAVFSWAISAVVGNRNLIRLSRRQDDSITPLLDELRRVSGAGETIANETSIVRFDRDNVHAQAAMSRAADVRIAWGGREAVDAIRDLPASWQCEDVIFGPRASLAVVDPNEMDEQSVRRLAIDIVMFDQLACSSPQQIFVKAPSRSRAMNWLIDSLAESFDEGCRSYPRHQLDFSETYRIALDRARAVLEGGEVRRGPSTSWTIALLDTPCDRLSCANRFVQVIPFSDIDQVYPHLPRNAQTVVTQLERAEAEEFTEKAAHLGVCRFPRPGEGNFFENPWDGVGIVSRLTRSVLRTEPSS